MYKYIIFKLSLIIFLKYFLKDIGLDSSKQLKMTIQHYNMHYL